MLIQFLTKKEVTYTKLVDSLRNTKIAGSLARPFRRSAVRTHQFTLPVRLPGRKLVNKSLS